MCPAVLWGTPKPTKHVRITTDCQKVMDIKGSIDIGNNYSVIGSYTREKGNWTDGDDDPSHWIRDWKYRSSELFVGMGKNVDLHPQNFGNIL